MKNFDLIEDYLFNRLSEEDRINFEKRVGSDKALAKELALQRIEFEIIDQMEEDDLRAKAMSWKKKLDTPKASQESITKPKEVKLIRKRRYLIPILAIAASLLLLIGVALPYFTSPQPNVLAQAYEGAKLEYTIGYLQKGNEGNSPFTESYLQVLEKRNKAKAKDAINYFSNFSSLNEMENIRAMVNLGHAYVLEGDFQSAVNTFTKVEKNSKAPDRTIEEVTFFKGVSLTQTENKKDGMQILINIQKANGRYAPLALSLIHI